MNDNVYWKLVAYFAPLSFLTIGGGASVIADMHRQVVDVYHWFSDADFLNIFALSRMTPGPGTLIVTMIGWKVAGFLGALVASIAIFVPSSALIYGAAHLWARYRGARWQRAIELGLLPIAAGMILVSAFSLLEAAAGGPFAWIMAGGSALLLLLTKLNPLLILCLGGAFYGLLLLVPGLGGMLAAT